MEVNEMHIIKDMRLPFIFHDIRLLGARPPAPRNWHENLEILYCQSGVGSIPCGDNTYPFCTGDTVVVNANHAHTVVAHSEELRYDCLIIDRGFCLSNGIDTNALFFDPHLQSAEIGRVMQSVHEEYASDDTPFRAAAIRAAVSVLLVLLCRNHSQTAPLSQSQPNLLSCIQKAIGIIHIEYKSPLSLDDVACRVGLSKYYFSREFRRVTGYPFVSYINVVRCEEAKRLLRQTPMRIAEIANACGFENQSYFTRTFRACTGSCPLNYRETHRGK